MGNYFYDSDKDQEYDVAPAEERVFSGHVINEHLKHQGIDYPCKNTGSDSSQKSLFQNVFYPIPSFACAARFVSIFALRDSSLVFLPAILGTPFFFGYSTCRVVCLHDIAAAPTATILLILSQS